MTWPTEADVTTVARILFLSITAHEDAAAVVGFDWSRIPAATRAPWEFTARRIVEQMAPSVRAELADAWEEGYDVGHRYARGVLPPDESDANPYTEEAGR